MPDGTQTRWVSFENSTGQKGMGGMEYMGANDRFGFELQIPSEIIEAWSLQDGNYPLKDMLSDRTMELLVIDGKTITRIDIEPLESFILSLL